MTILKIWSIIKHRTSDSKPFDVLLAQRYNKAIDDFSNKAFTMLKEEQDTRYGYLDGMDIRDIAEQLKAGGENVR